jgi:hypothetical protein
MGMTGGEIMLRLIWTAGLAVLLVGGLACGNHRGTVKPSAGAQCKEPSPSHGSSPSRGPPFGEQSQVGDCSRCYVDLLRPWDPAVRIRICGSTPKGPERRGEQHGPAKEHDGEAPGAGRALCCGCADGACCRHCDSPGGEPYQTPHGSDYTISVGPGAVVLFSREDREVRRIGPVEFTASEVGIDQPLPLQIFCRDTDGAQEHPSH